MRRLPRSAAGAAAPASMAHTGAGLPAGPDADAAAGSPAAAFDRPSKTARKRDAHDQQALGRDLAGLSPERLEALTMPEPLRDALREFQRTRSHEGRRRQMQYIGKLMRTADAAALREAVAASRLGSAQDTLRLHQAERWREELVRDPDALTRWMAEHPASDVQRLRQLLRQAHKDAAAPNGQRHSRAWRELFQFIRPHIGPHLAGAGPAAPLADDDAPDDIA